MNTRSLAIALTVALLLTGCSQPHDETTPTITLDPVVRPSIPAEFVDRIDGSTATIPLTTAALKWLRGTDEGLYHNMTDQAYDNLIEGTKDIIFVTTPSEGELAAAQEAGVDLEVIPIVKDALVFLANTANPVSTLTQQQVKDIYTGTITNWKDVGGKDTDIIPYQRQVDSGSQTLFLQIAMGNTVPMDVPMGYTVGYMYKLIDALSEYDNAEDALGYSVYYYADQMYTKDNVKLLSIDGIAPTNESISTDSYPYGTHYFAVIRSTEPTDSTARQLIEWFLTWEGQQVSSGAGYVPLDPSNIVPLSDTRYGYLGSTPENTTQSSGTGGPRSFVPQDVEYDCVWDGSACGLQDQKIRIPGYPQAEKTLQEWVDAQPHIEPPDPTLLVQWWMDIYKDLMIVWHGFVSLEELALASWDTVIIRLADGKKLALSDFFYDDVNYIEFINRNLLVPGINPRLDDIGGHHSRVDSMTVFTGLPSTFDDFGFDLHGFVLLFNFPIGNPFVKSDPPHDPYVSLGLPADLSPYGVYWRIDKVTIGSASVEHLVRDYIGVNPIDVIINDNIDAFVRAHSEWDFFPFTSINDESVCLSGLDSSSIPGIWEDRLCMSYATGQPI